VFVELEDLLASDESFAAQAGKRRLDCGVLGVVDPLVAVLVWLDVVDFGNDVIGGWPLPNGFELPYCAQALALHPGTRVAPSQAPSTFQSP